MQFVLGIILAAFMFMTAPAQAQDAQSVASAEAAAVSWLALVDAGDYARSWDQAAGMFQGSITRTDWVKAAADVRSSLGRLISRKVKSATFTRTLPGAPDGEYIVIQYDSQFQHKPSAIETVTRLREQDGSWKVSGYFIR